MEKSTRHHNSMSSLLILTLSFSFTSLCFANTFVFNPRSHSWKAIDDYGQVVRVGRASGGKPFCSDTGRRCFTPSGVFAVHSKGGPGCKSSKFPVGIGGAPMPYCMFYSKYYAIHGSYDVPKHHASHGCIRVTPSDARWLSANFIRIGSRVVVKPY
ncbi:MAG: L,D-transpeptidase [Legionella sp.]|nr:L,D-transpeptidase [Legionella sp.]